MNTTSYFSSNYALQRQRFLDQATKAQLSVESHLHPLRGREGEELAMDVARLGPAGSQHMLIITSGTHGLEGFSGSGIQLALMDDPEFHALATASGVSILYVHGVNPWGFSWYHRWTHENVDLNRNFLDFSDSSITNEGFRYPEIADFIVPANWPDAQADEQMATWIAANDMAALIQAVTGGQRSHPDGLFFCGNQPTWSNQTFRHVLRTHAAGCTQAAIIDLHTGLGPCGHGERIVAPQDDRAHARVKAWWGNVTSVADGSSSSAKVSGYLCGALDEEIPGAEVTAMVLEFGTVPMPEVLDALRADQWLIRQTDPDPVKADAIKQQVLAAFYVDTDEWKQQLVEQAIEASHQAARGLAGGL
ncbi:M14 family metallopeptidase [Parasphingorhabdus halotolerans]|uniref:DUF2817 domain-containing protein n=1 Tax=Parasphingorhabdus halotolerans TaxID=2725558 RepID=A0A6H2DJX3_9SPHN|nr:M14 family metallopeptidase [Parasphingorhabdus halotolerans]QJB68245.1 DUF2817 domain-containing protein [Parasphingorhabdus halotolerans]